MTRIDCRGKACPHPVLMAKEALEKQRQGEWLIIVDDSTARENVERFAKSQGCSVRAEDKGGDTYIYLQRGPGEEEKRVSTEGKTERVVVYINSQFLGIGDEALGSILMRSFLKTLLGLKTRPNRVILINSGVRLATEGSEVLETLQTLTQRGVDILSCGTCLDFYGLKGEVRVGVISNMYDIAQSLLEADRLIRP